MSGSQRQPGNRRTFVRLYVKSAGDKDNDYLIDHSAAVVLFDPDGRFHALFNVPHDADKIASDFLLIKNYYEATR